MWKQKKLSFSEIFFVIAVLLLIICLGIAAFEYIRVVEQALFYPYPLEYSEGPILDQTVRLSHFKNIYRNDFSDPPYTVSNNPPLFQLIQVPFTWIAGPAYWYGRLISVLSTIVAATLIGLILYTLTKDRLASVISSSILLSFPYILQWTVYDQVDTLALALSLGGLYVILRKSDSPKGLWVSALLFSIAVYTRYYSILACPLAAFLWLYHSHKRRQALILIALLAGICLGLFLIMNSLTRGGFFLHTVLANLAPFSWHTVTRYIAEFYINAGLLILACMLFLFVERLGEWTRSWPLLISYLIGATITGIMIGKAGSSVSYLFDIVVWLSLVSGAMIAWTGKNYWLKSLLVLILAYQIVGLINWSRRDYIPLIIEKVSAYHEVTQIANMIQQVQGPVLTDEYMGLLPLLARDIYFQPLEYKILEEANLWSEERLLKSIQNQEFPIILFYFPRRWNPVTIRWAPSIRYAIYGRYQRDRILADNLVYLPR